MGFPNSETNIISVNEYLFPFLSILSVPAIISGLYSLGFKGELKG